MCGGVYEEELQEEPETQDEKKPEEKEYVYPGSDAQV